MQPAANAFFITASIATDTHQQECQVHGQITHLCLMQRGAESLLMLIKSKKEY